MSGSCALTALQSVSLHFVKNKNKHYACGISEYMYSFTHKFRSDVRF